MKTIKTTLKDCAISIGIAVVIIISLEACFRFLKFASLRVVLSSKEEEVYRDRFIAFDEAVPIRDLKARQSEVGDHLMYKPWIQIGNYDHKGEFSTVVNGSRIVKGIDGLKNCLSTKEIWMFGGSTTYGWGVPDSDNIPSFLQQILNKHQTCLKVVNFGVPLHYSKQESINFVDKLLELEKPPLVAIFLDGLNDFGQPGSTLRGEPFFTPTLTNLVPRGSNFSNNGGSNSPIMFNLKFIKFLQSKIIKSSNPSTTHNRNYKIPSEYTEALAVKEISRRFIENTIKLGKICNAYEVKCYRFLQPVPAVHYTPPVNDGLTSWVQNEKRASRFRNGYSLILSNINSEIYGINFLDLSNLFKEYSGIPYVDEGHYSPRANKLVSESIFSAISPVITP